MFLYTIFKHDHPPKNDFTLLNKLAAPSITFSPGYYAYMISEKKMLMQ